MRNLLAPETNFAYSRNVMSDANRGESSPRKPWTFHAAKLLGKSESFVLVLIGVALVLVAVLLLYSSMYDLNEAAHHGPGEIEHKAIEILNMVLLVMMTMEIVYTVAISLESHTLNAEPFLIIGVIAGIRRMLVITATSTEVEVHPEQFRNTLVELGLLAATVIALAVAIWILRYSAHNYPREKQIEHE
jgi:cell division protein FtsL